MKRLRATALTAAAALGLAAVMAGSAGAGTPLPGKQHSMSFGPFCVSKATGVMRAPQHTQPCHQGEVRIRHLRVPLAGPTGVAGPQGVQGVQGVKGDTGATGAQGQAGTSVTTSQVERGPTCAEGGIAVTGAGGTLYLCNGARGPQGLTGAIGAIGAIGPKGDTGATGATGAIGPIGPKGDTGDTGATGQIGQKGDTGAAGVPGAAGTSVTTSVVSKGSTCEEGGIAVTDAAGTLYLCNGVRGPQGLVGLQGPMGDTGLQGPKGDTGLQGPKGDTGAMGPQGPPGLAGLNGSAIVTVAGGQTSGDKQFTVACDNGMTALGGGFDVQGSVTASFRSSPTGDPTGTTAWTIRQSSGATLSGTVFVYCVATR